MAEEEEINPEEEKEEKNVATKKGFPLKIIILSTLFLFFLGGGFFAWKAGVFAKLASEIGLPLFLGSLIVAKFGEH